MHMGREFQSLMTEGRKDTDELYKRGFKSKGSNDRMK